MVADGGKTIWCLGKKRSLYHKEGRGGRTFVLKVEEHQGIYIYIRSGRLVRRRLEELFNIYITC